MRIEEILAGFDGRGRASFLIGAFQALDPQVITAIAYECGYDLQATEAPSRSSVRLTYVRNDSPPARRRAWQTQERLRAGGPLLPVWEVPGPQPGSVWPVTAVAMASTRQRVAAYEASGAKGPAVGFALLGLGCFVLAWVVRGTPGPALGMGVLGVLLGAVAALTPRWAKRWYERNRQLVRIYDRQRSGTVAPPSPPPTLARGRDGRTDGAGADAG
ncbi:MAG: hypothetical protein HOY79_24195 [Streptomyces sp.]|nr:hypothetical protein [Streptomyces sp.]